MSFSLPKWICQIVFRSFAWVLFDLRKCRLVHLLVILWHFEVWKKFLYVTICRNVVRLIWKYDLVKLWLVKVSPYLWIWFFFWWPLIFTRRTFFGDVLTNARWCLSQIFHAKKWWFIFKPDMESQFCFTNGWLDKKWSRLSSGSNGTFLECPCCGRFP